MEYGVGCDCLVFLVVVLFLFYFIAWLRFSAFAVSFLGSWMSVMHGALTPLIAFCNHYRWRLLVSQGGGCGCCFALTLMWVVVGVGNTRWLLVLFYVNGEVVVVSIGLGVGMFVVLFAWW